MWSKWPGKVIEIANGIIMMDVVSGMHTGVDLVVNDRVGPKYNVICNNVFINFAVFM